MSDWTLSDVISGTNGALVQGNDCEISGFSIDSRTIKPKEVFFALKGEKQDGCEFIPQALSNHASIIVSSRPPIPSDEKKIFPASWILVEDTLNALQNLARWHRNRHKGVFLGVTGSNGKTTTKEMLFHLFSSVSNISATSGNLNNHIGLPLNIVRIPLNTKFSIVEMGMNHQGEIRFLTEISKPHSGLITNIGPAHIEFLGSLLNIAHAKAELIETLPSDGFAVLNGDDQFFSMLSQKTPAKVVSFGTSSNCDFHFTEINCDPFGISSRISRKNSLYSMSLNLLGKHNALNSLGALALYSSYGFSLQEGVEILKTFKPVNSRMESHQIDGMRVILDCYNANPSSMANAVELLSYCPGRRVAVLGDMRELGKESESLHEQLGRLVASRKIDQLVGVGALAQVIVEGAVVSGMTPSAVHSCRDTLEATKCLANLLSKGDTVLLKASRGMHFELIVKELWPSLPCDLH